MARPGDVALNLGSDRLLVDITIASPFSTAGHQTTRLAGSPIAAAELAYDRKLKKWRQLLSDHQLDAKDHLIYVLATGRYLGIWDERLLLWLRSYVCAICVSL